MLGTIVTGLVFGGSAVAALAIMKRDHGEAHRARKRAIDEATEPWRALYADKERSLPSCGRSTSRRWRRSSGSCTGPIRRLRAGT